MGRENQLGAWADRYLRGADGVATVFGYLCRRGTHPLTARDRAEEAVQEGLLRVLAKYGDAPERFTSETHFANTVTRAALNWAIAQYGRRMTPLPLLDFDTADVRPDAPPDMTEELKRALAALPAEDRELLRRKYEEGWTLQELADHENSTVAKVWARLDRLRARLRAALASA